ncbi:hypothetical protein PGB90_009519 [Kerria lacca]
MEFSIENALRKYFAKTIGTEGKSKFLRFVQDEDTNDVPEHTLNYSRGKICYEKDGKTYFSQNLFLKLMNDTASARIHEVKVPKGLQTVIFLNELFFYTSMKPFFDSFRKMDDLLVPFNYTSIEGTFESNFGILIFDDMKTKEFVSWTKQYLDYDHLALLLRKIGQFHAYSFQAKKKNPATFFRFGEFFIDSMGAGVSFSKTWMQNHLKTTIKYLYNDSRYDLPLKTLDEILENLPNFYRNITNLDNDNEMVVLAHQACKSENILFRYENDKLTDLKILDWQTCRLTSLATDIITVLYLEASQQMREKKWDSLIDEYYAGLNQVFTDNDIPSRDAIREEIETRLPYLLVILTQKFLKQKTDITHQLTEIIKDLLQRLINRKV